MIRIALCFLLCAASASPAATTPLSLPVQPAKFSMARDFTLSFDHALGVAEAKRRVDVRFKKLQEKFGGQVASSSLSWSGDDAFVLVSVLGQRANAQVSVTAEHIRLRVHLPLLLTPLSGKIQDVLTEAADESLRS